MTQFAQVKRFSSELSNFVDNNQFEEDPCELSVPLPNLKKEYTDTELEKVFETNFAGYQINYGVVSVQPRCHRYDKH